MANLSFTLLCRNCGSMEAMRHAYWIQEDSKAAYLNDSDFQAVLKIENQRREDDDVCIKCGSDNVEISDVQMDDFPLYDFDRLISIRPKKEVFIIKIRKIENGLEIEHGGLDDLNPSFLYKSFRELSRIISSIQVDKFVSLKKGMMFIVLSGIFSQGLEGYKLSVETFKFHGLSKDQIENAIDELLNEINKKRFLRSLTNPRS